MIFEDLIEEDFKDDLDKKIDAQKKRSSDWRSHYVKNRGYQGAPENISFKNLNKNKEPYHNSRWVIKDKVIRSGRPGYYVGHAGEEVIKPWLNKIIGSTGQKPKSVITFLTDKELNDYYDKDFNLIKYYEKLFGPENVKRMPKNDPAYYGGHGNVFNLKEVEQVKEWIKELPKPVLIHCSAGIDRTGEISKYLMGDFYNTKNNLINKQKQKQETLIQRRETDEDGTERIILKNGNVWERKPDSAKWEKVGSRAIEKPKYTGDRVKDFYTRFKERKDKENKKNLGGWENV